MFDDDDWKRLIDEATTKRLPSIKAMGYRRGPVGSFAAPPLLVCDDGEDYWVKHRFFAGGNSESPRSAQLGGMITDHIVGTLARLLQAEAIPEVRLVDIGSDLISVEPRLSNAIAGLAHGSRNAATNCTGRLDFAHGGFNRLPMNRSRVATLAILYGLTRAADHQVIFRLGGDPLVYSVDHGHFFPSGPNWNVASLEHEQGGSVDQVVVRECVLGTDELAEPIRRLAELTARSFAEAVASPPDTWQFPEVERIAVARFLWKRRDAILRSSN